MAIKKNNNQAQNSDKNITYYQKKFWKIFLYGMGAVGLFFLFAWGLLVRCLLLKI
jgi:penicillin-binding protein 1A